MPDSVALFAARLCEVGRIKRRDPTCEAPVCDLQLTTLDGAHECLGRNGAAEVKPLGKVAAERAQLLEGIFSLDALCHH